MMYACYIPSVGIAGIGSTPEESKGAAAQILAEIDEDVSKAVLVVGQVPDTEQNCEQVRIRRCTERLAAAYFGLGDEAPLLCFEINEHGLLDLA